MRRVRAPFGQFRPPHLKRPAGRQVRRRPQMDQGGARVRRQAPLAPHRDARIGAGDPTGSLGWGRCQGGGSGPCTLPRATRGRPSPRGFLLSLPCAPRPPGLLQPRGPPELLQPPRPPGARGGRGRFRSGRAMARLGREPTDHGGRWQPLCMAGAAEGGGLFLRITNGFGGRARDPARVYRPAVRGFSVAIPCRDF